MLENSNTLCTPYVGLYPEPPLPVAVLLQHEPQIPVGNLGPELVHEEHLGVGHL